MRPLMQRKLIHLLLCKYIKTINRIEIFTLLGNAAFIDFASCLDIPVTLGVYFRATNIYSTKNVLLFNEFSNETECLKYHKVFLIMSYLEMLSIQKSYNFDC